MQLEWATDSAFRFFPTQPDELFGYLLHPVDLATNKASADRRVPRDVVDLVTIHETVLPLGAVVAAACGKFIGTTPEEMLAEITRHSRFTAEEFQVLATGQPIDVRGLHRRIRSRIEDAENFIAGLPSDAVGVIFMDGAKPVRPDVNALEAYQRNHGAPGGLRPSPHVNRSPAGCGDNGASLTLLRSGAAMSRPAKTAALSDSCAGLKASGSRGQRPLVGAGLSPAGVRGSAPAKTS